MRRKEATAEAAVDERAGVGVQAPEEALSKTQRLNTDPCRPDT